MPGASPNSRGRLRATRLVVIAQTALLIVSAFGMPAATAAAGNNALQFDGTNDYVTFGAAPSLGVTTFTLETWFKRTGAGVGVTTGSGGIPLAIPLVTNASPGPKSRHNASPRSLQCRRVR